MSESTVAYVYSTLTNNTKYTNYKKGGGDIPLIAGAVLIKGGSNVIDGHFVTPQGIVTQVSESELAILNDNVVFKRHVERGYIRVEKIEVKKIENVVADMIKRDESAPLVPEDYNAEDAASSEKKKAPVVNSKKGKR